MFLILVGMAMVAGFVGSAQAGGGPQNVAIVVNANSWASLAVANAYVQMRRIPPNNVIYLEDLPDFERTDVATFRDRILQPVLEVLKDRKLESQIDVIAYSSDLPTAIVVRGDLGALKLPKIFTPVASINGLTYLYQLVLAKDPRYLQLNVNRYLRRPVRETDPRPVQPADKKVYAAAVALMGEKKWKQAATTLKPLADRYRNSPELQYNYACCLAQAGQKKEAVASLLVAVDAGWVNVKHAQQDPDLASLRERSDFKSTVQKMAANAKLPFDVQPTSALRSRYYWNPMGDRVDAGGSRYLLSIVLAVTSGRGNSVQQAIDSLRRSVRADHTRPDGTIYFMENSNVRSTTRQNVFPAAVKALKDANVRGEIVKGTIPKEKDDVMGAMIGAASFDWAASGSTILPGAICEHLTSLGGVMRQDGGQTPLTEFIRYGAAGSSGTVTEPYAIQAKFPFAFIHVHYARGCSLIESFYQSVFGPYQLLIVGDPLCQPWARTVGIDAGGLKVNQRLSGRVTIKPRLVETDNTPPGSVDHFEVFVDGLRRKTCRPGQAFDLDTNGMPDGWYLLSVVAVAADPIETQSRLMLPVRVDNHGRQVTLDVPNGSRVAWNDTVSLRAKAVEAESIELWQNGRKLGSIRHASGTFAIAAKRLGMGPVALQAVAHYQDGTAHSQPLSLNVNPPQATVSLRSPPPARLEDGFQLSINDKAPVVITDTKDRKWLAKQGVKQGDAFTLVGWFQTPAQTLAQFQFRGSVVRKLTVDGVPIWQSEQGRTAAGSWQMLPVTLKKGMHKLELSGIGAKSSMLEIRFGSRGCARLDGKRFRHEKK